MSETVPDLDNQIAAMEIQLSELKTRRNHAASLLYRIPDDIIRDILVELQLSLQSTGSLRYWARAIVICRRMYTIAVEAPELWSRFEIMCTEHTDKTDARLRQWLTVCEERGGNRPSTLFLDLGNFSDLSVPLYRDIMRLAPRAKNLWIKDTHSTHCDAFYRYLIHPPWPALNTLKIETSSMNSYIHSKDLGGFSDTLTSLCLIHRYPNDKERYRAWKYVQFPHLPRLKRLTVMGLELTHLKARDDFRDDLGRMPCLEFLEVQRLHDPVNQGSADRSIPQGSSYMSHLRCLKLDGSAGGICLILPLLPNPSKELSIKINVGVGSQSISQMRVIRDRALTHLRHLSQEEDAPELNISLGPCHKDLPSLIRIEISSLCQSKASAMVDRGSLEFFGCCEINDLSHFFCLAGQITFYRGAQDYFQQTLPRIAAANPAISHLGFSYGAMFLSYGGTQQFYRQVFENYLTARKQKGCTLLHLQVANDSVGFPASLDQMIVRWLKDGLVNTVSVDRHSPNDAASPLLETRVYTASDFDPQP